MPIDRECLKWHKNFELIYHWICVENIEIERFCVANASITHLHPSPPSAGVVADVRPSLSAETDGIVPTSALFWIGPSGQAIRVAYRLVCVSVCVSVLLWTAYLVESVDQFWPNLAPFLVPSPTCARFNHIVGCNSQIDAASEIGRCP